MDILALPKISEFINGHAILRSRNIQKDTHSVSLKVKFFKNFQTQDRDIETNSR